MKRVLLLSILAQGLAENRLDAGGHLASLQACSALAASSLCIINGAELKAEDQKKYQSTVPLRIDLPNNRERNFNGTIVGKNTIITAGHTVKEQALESGVSLPSALPEVDFYLDRETAKNILSDSAKEKYLKTPGDTPIKLRAKVITHYTAVDSTNFEEQGNQRDAAVLIFEDESFSESAVAKAGMKEFPAATSGNTESIVAVATSYTEAKFDRNGSALNINQASLRPETIKKTKASFDVAGVGPKILGGVTDYDAGEAGIIVGDSGGGVYSKDNSYVGIIGMAHVMSYSNPDSNKDRLKMISGFVPLSNPDLAPLWKEAESRGATGLNSLTGSAGPTPKKLIWKSTLSPEAYKKIFQEAENMGKPNNCPPLPDKK